MSVFHTIVDIFLKSAFQERDLLQFNQSIIFQLLLFKTNITVEVKEAIKYNANTLIVKACFIKFQFVT